VQRPSDELKMESSARAFRGDYIDYGRECFVEANINNQSK
jgi:hypothetical protein